MIGIKINQPNNSGIVAKTESINPTKPYTRKGIVFLRHPIKLFFIDSIGFCPSSIIKAGANQNAISNGT